MPVCSLGIGNPMTRDWRVLDKPTVWKLVKSSCTVGGLTQAHWGKRWASELAGQERHLQTSSWQLPHLMVNFSNSLHCALEAELGSSVGSEVSTGPSPNSFGPRVPESCLRELDKGSARFLLFPQILVDLTPGLKLSSPNTDPRDSSCLNISQSQQTSFQRRNEC